MFINACSSCWVSQKSEQKFLWKISREIREFSWSVLIWRKILTVFTIFSEIILTRSWSHSCDVINARFIDKISTVRPHDTDISQKNFLITKDYLGIFRDDLNDLNEMLLRHNSWRSALTRAVFMGVSWSFYDQRKLTGKGADVLNFSGVSMNWKIIWIGWIPIRVRDHSETSNFNW